MTSDAAGAAQAQASLRLAGRAGDLAAARLRTALENRRGAWRLQGIAAQGRAAGRAALTLPRLPGDLDAGDPALAALTDPARTQRVRDAAAAMLAGHRLALAVTPADRADTEVFVTAEVRQLALRHRHLAFAPDERPLPDLLAAASARIDAVWRARLPDLLADEWPGGSDADPAPQPDEPAAPGAPARRRPRVRMPVRMPWSRKRPALPTDPCAAPPEARPVLALDAALAACAGPVGAAR